MHYHVISRPCVRGVGAAVALSALLGCASGSEDPHTPGEPAPSSDETARPETAPGPIIVEQDPDDAPPAPDEDAAAEEEAIAADEISQEESTRVFRDPSDPPRRGDGRPLWWFDETRRDNGEARVCAEAIGESILQARRGAIARGREQAAREGVGAGSIVYERIWIWPTRETGRVDPRYAAFVMLRFARED